jgi:SAM-dependent methyltransferase
MIHYSNCPVCLSESIIEEFSAEDNTVSHEMFSIWKCNTCSVRFTQDIPEQDVIGKYYQSDSYVSHSDTKRGFINAMYHHVRNYTLNLKRKLVEKEVGTQSGDILDIGCGTGAFLNNMKNAGWSVTGLEPDETAKAKAFELYKINPQQPSSLFQLEGKTYDAITLWHVLEHVHQLDDYMQQLKKILKDKGAIFIAVPNHTSNDAGYYKEKWAAYDVPRHLYHFSPNSMEVLLQRHGMKLKKIKPMWFDSFYVSMLSEKIKTGKNNIIKALIRGGVSNLQTVLNRRKCSSLIYIITK